MILIFGANGFLGSALMNYLGATSEVIGVVRPGSDLTRIHSRMETKIISAVPETWNEIIESTKPDRIICAQWEGVTKAERNNPLIQERNVSQIVKLAHVAKRTNVKSFIAFGSQAECQEIDTLIPETPTKGASTAYGEAKDSLLRKLLAEFTESKTRLIWLRVFSVYGPNDDQNNLIPQLIATRSSGQPLRIKNSKRKWSYLFIEDFVTSVEKIIETYEIQGVVNIGNPQFVTIEDICKATPNTLFSLKAGSSANNVGYFPDLKKLLSTGWIPQYTLAEGVKITVNQLEH